MSHPNVVQVFAVGPHQGRLFVAMERVRGQALRAWMHTGPRSWREVERPRPASGSAQATICK